MVTTGTGTTGTGLAVSGTCSLVLCLTRARVTCTTTAPGFVNAWCVSVAGMGRAASARPER